VSPFRDAPPVELGPLDVGLPRAVARAIAHLPRGGRVIAARAKASGRASLHVVGALGTAGLFAFVIAAAAAWATGWRPASALDLALVGAAIVIGGASLAAVLAALDRRPMTSTRPGDRVGAEAQAILRRLSRLALLLGRGRKVPGTTLALRRAIAAASDPDVARWIPVDLRGRAELLLARALVADAGSRLAPAARRDVRELLSSAAEHLDRPEPARADLDALDRVPARIARGSVAEEHADLAALVEEPRASARL
jgi:hypothetical protein